ncbi:major histocompatibility complex class I-related gene protein-like [Entelurus aequoreus]|uniref:major histocompatibility complex class I-related gene protein-like n=1 Tax=Entelurus aequoreus TaxID=161455 RepID=UPI002B1DDF5C|nr:major histocompatibility complex class I-related gene protein-like [Entelurus aequoreus]
MNFFLFFLLVVQMHSVTPVIHTLQYFHTASSQVQDFPEYVSVGYVDGVEISYYDNNIRKAESKQDWMNKITAEDPNYWQMVTEISVGCVHIYQRMSGCEWNDETDEVKGWYQEGYDGEDFLSLDMKTWTYTAAKPQAFPDKLKWDQNIPRLDYDKYYYTERCPSYLKKHVKNGKKVLMRTELPEVFLLQKTPSSPVTCMATGFYPDLADLFWRKDGEQMFEDVEHRELLPNHDGTFQMSVELKVEVTAEVEGKYECVFQLSGVKEDLVTKLERRSIPSNTSHEGEKDTFSWRCFPSQVHLSPLLIHVTMTTLDVCMQSSHEGFLFMLCHSTCAFLLSTDNWSVALAATAAVVAVAAVLAAIIIVMVRRHRNRQAQYDPAHPPGAYLTFDMSPHDEDQPNETSSVLTHQEARHGGVELSEKVAAEGEG